MTRSFWAWGEEEKALDADERAAVKMLVGARLGVSDLTEAPPPSLASIRLPRSRVEGPSAAPAAIAALFSTTRRDRASHTYGKAYRDIMRGLAGDFASAPDAVAFPKSEADLVAVLAYCDERGHAAIPFGGGSSTVGGVEPRRGPAIGDDRVAISIDLVGLDKVLEIDRASRAARVQAGIYGPALEAALKPHGLSLRH